MPHPLVSQLRFARSEFARCIDGVSADDAVQRLVPMNCLSWIVGHMANQEHFHLVRSAQDREVVQGLNDLVGFGKPASTPPWAEMLAAWQHTTSAADAFLDSVTADMLDTHLSFGDQTLPESIGRTLQRIIFHYWFHTGEAHAIRQQLGHKDLPDFVGDMSDVTYE